jgi:hypothetical protein
MFASISSRSLQDTPATPILPATVSFVHHISQILRKQNLKVFLYFVYNLQTKTDTLSLNDYAYEIVEQDTTALVRRFFEIVCSKFEQT